MISESTQEQAALYALELLDADEAAAFERELDAHAELRGLVMELRDASSSLAEAAEAEAALPPPPALRGRVLSRIAAEGGQWANETAAAADYPAKGKVVAGPWGKTWLPWALAATLMICCGALAVSRERWRRDFSTLERKTAAVEASAEQMRIAQATATTAANADPLQKVAFVPLEPVKPSSLPLAAVLWDAAHRQGELRIAHLKPPGEGKDYQLWVVEDGKKDAVSAGIVTPGADGSVSVPFQPVAAGGKAVAFALSLERAGGSPTNQGPILFVGKL